MKFAPQKPINLTTLEREHLSSSVFTDTSNRTDAIIICQAKQYVNYSKKLSFGLHKGTLNKRFT